MLCAPTLKGRMSVAVKGDLKEMAKTVQVKCLVLLLFLMQNVC